ncbi:unnamed protein product [Discosporangium mesarthrocarpum]
MKRTRQPTERTSSPDASVDSLVNGVPRGLRVHEWGLNPLFWSFARLLVRDVHSLATLDGIEDSHVLYGKPICRAQVAGVVVHIKRGSTKQGSYVKYLLDDGTGFIGCTQYDRDLRGMKRNVQGDVHQLGDFLIVRGKLKRFKGTREIMIVNARNPNDPNEEVLHWVWAIQLAKTVYSLPFEREAFINERLVLKASQQAHAHPPRCLCRAPYALQLGYCRCVASPLPCDPGFLFRGALLSHLAAMENALPQGNHLRFHFAGDIRDDPGLQSAARRVVDSAATATAPGTSSREAGSVAEGAMGEGSAAAVSGLGGQVGGGGGARVGGERGGRRNVPSVVGNGGVTDATRFSERGPRARVIDVFRATMSRLKRDGVVHLDSEEEDMYLLISSRRVLRPRIKALCRMKGLQLTQDSEIIRGLQISDMFHHVPGSRIRACLQGMRGAVRARNGGGEETKEAEIEGN